MVWCASSAAETDAGTQAEVRSCLDRLGPPLVEGEDITGSARIKPVSAACLKALRVNCATNAQPAQCLTDLTGEYDRRTAAIAAAIQRGIEGGKLRDNRITREAAERITQARHATRRCGEAAIAPGLDAGLPRAVLVDNCGAGYQWFQAFNMFGMLVLTYRID